MEINVTCNQFCGYSSARVELDGSCDLPEPIECSNQEPLAAIAVAVLRHLITTGQLKLVLNEKEIVTQENDETPYQDFFENSEWFYDHDIIK
jgi:hypothetical protein